jgi:SAM-dependent methyltransferase
MDRFDQKEDSLSFDRVAESYDAYRPAYPEELFESLISMTGLQTDSKILEVGSGTGKATAMLARRGFSIHGIEPGQHLGLVAARNLKNYPRVDFETVAFERWQERPGEFDLVMSAQAFHWVSKEIGYAKAARTLKENGHLALFWNMDPEPTDAIFLALSKVYHTRAPELADRPDSFESLIKQREADIRDCGFFSNVRTRRFPWSARYNAAQYLGLLSTYSDHLRLTADKRHSLFEGVEEVIANHGGSFEKPYVAVLYLAQRTA